MVVKRTKRHYPKKDLDTTPDSMYFASHPAAVNDVRTLDDVNDVRTYAENLRQKEVVSGRLSRRTPRRRTP